MSHNTSLQKAAAYVRAQPLAGYIDWHLLATCDTCAREARLAVRSIEGYAPGRTVSVMLGRLRCYGCRRAPSRVAFERSGRQVVVMGPGSY